MKLSLARPPLRPNRKPFFARLSIDAGETRRSHRRELLRALPRACRFMPDMIRTNNEQLAYKTAHKSAWIRLSALPLPRRCREQQDDPKYPRHVTVSARREYSTVDRAARQETERHEKVSVRLGHLFNPAMIALQVHGMAAFGIKTALDFVDK